ncbi:MAG TPA: hypothetical protein VMX12_07510 [Acidimicrobiia bacterium]|nr:hypothetical protein [Acidimicrobiia bacterium]
MSDLSITVNAYAEEFYQAEREDAGYRAQRAGRPRITPHIAPSAPPGSPASKLWAKKSEDWYRGWDRANLEDLT